MGGEVVPVLTSVVGIAGKHVSTAGGGGNAHIELWQAINLIGAPMLAMIFAGPVIDDVKAWWAARRPTDPANRP